MLSTKQRTSKCDKQSPVECTKEKIGKNIRKIGGWAAQSLMGLPNNIQTTNMSHSFRPYL